MKDRSFAITPLRRERSKERETPVELFSSGIGFGTLALLLFCLLIALSFEFVNGFHDTANAVATVIYTKSLKPTQAVVWSGLCNFTGVCVSITMTGGAVAFGVVHLLPVDLLISTGGAAGIMMVLSLLLSAIIWNAGTWYFGLPASSSHALFGSIIGVGLASSLFNGKGFGSGVNWTKTMQTFESLLFSPLIGFFVAALLLVVVKTVIKNPALYQEPKGDQPPPLWIRAILCFTCSGVSFFHGSNDGQKGMGLIMLILIGLAPAQYALNSRFDAEQIGKTTASIGQLQRITTQYHAAPALTADLADLQTKLSGQSDLKSQPEPVRTALRTEIMRTVDALDKFAKSDAVKLSKEDKKAFDDNEKQLKKTVDFIAPWVIGAVAIALGLGTMIGWKRIVVTVGEKIGKTHLTYAQGAVAELVAMACIFAGDTSGKPISTTHVLSSGVAGTMWANKSGLQVATIRNIALAWVLTLPVTALLSGLLFCITAGPFLKSTPQASTPSTPARAAAQTK